MAGTVKNAQEMQTRLRRAQNAMMEIGQLGRQLGTGQKQPKAQQQARLQQLINDVGQELQEIQRYADRQFS
ncbi:hypothetical protein [Limnochorda pilosa]|uniref:Uncharacterized protein n=1 Tax=Limnochorda pilosa TaxID=1555112 RepID=A0A0K2SFW7_LIMPI|nr:hypothetical protein [Limnochorda pilosa]BAS25998.1 hypothetical protein LIP_0141 [Limnochorda pilosa]